MTGRKFQSAWAMTDERKEQGICRAESYAYGHKMEKVKIYG